jgi:release factor glutamine methyltransferase
VTQTNTEQWTTGKLLDWMSSKFEGNNIESPRLISEMLLTNLLGGQRIDLYANINRIASETELEKLRGFVKRTLEHEPVQYIVGKTWFNGSQFDVNSSTLIPRSCTERIVEQVIQFCREKELTAPQIADIGTGTGCIAITIASNLPTCNITASDISKDALDLATKNAEKIGVLESISFILGDGTSPISSLKPFDVICSNPPYIPDSEMKTLDPNVRKWEPELALSGGVDGLKVITPLIETAPQILVQGGLLLIEIDTSHSCKVLEIAQSQQDLKNVKILRDQFGDDRFLSAIKC